MSSKEPAAATATADSPTVYDFPCDEAVVAVFRVAACWVPFRNKPSGRLSTTLMFFSLCLGVRWSAAPAALKANKAAWLFSAAVREVVGVRYADAFQGYFSLSQEELLALNFEPDVPLPRATTNVEKMLTSAKELAQASGAAVIGVEHLIEALLALDQSRLQELLERLEIEPQVLLTEYRDARYGQIAMTLHNDVASTEDRLGYDSFAEAISEFLMHAQTPPPLSISIQAPWGVGKSSLMMLVRERLDPKAEREKHKPKPGSPLSAPRLLLGRVQKFLDRSEPLEVTVEAGRSRLWTVWFNAWKYETSEQIWAGLVDAIVSQIGERLPLIEREKFYLKLQLARIDDGIVRRKIHDQIASVWWGRVRGWTLLGGTAILSLLGFGAAAPALPEVIQKAIALWSDSPLLGALMAQIILSVYLVGSYFKTRQTTRAEPATFSLSEYIRVPDYSKAVGEIHQIHLDLRRVLDVVPKNSQRRRSFPDSRFS